MTAYEGPPRFYTFAGPRAFPRSEQSAPSSQFLRNAQVLRNCRARTLTAEDPPRPDVSSTVSTRCINIGALGALLALAPLSACSEEAAGVCSEEALVARLDAAAAGETVTVGACTIAVSSISIPAGVRLQGTGAESAIQTSGGAMPGITVLDGATLESIEVRASDGTAVAVVGGTGTLRDVDIIGPVTADRALDFGVVVPANRIGLVLADAGGTTPVLLEDVNVRGFADFAVNLFGSRVSWDRGTVGAGLGSGIFQSGGDAELRSVTIEGMLQGGRLTAGFGGVTVDGAMVRTEALLVRDNEGAGLLHDASSVSHADLSVIENQVFGLWTQRGSRFVIEGASSFERNDGPALSILDPAGAHDVRGVDISETRRRSTVVGMGGDEDIADGIHIVADDSTMVRLEDVTLRDNERAGLLVTVRGGVVDPASFVNVSVDAAGSQLGAIAQEPEMTIPLGTWDVGITRTGAAEANDLGASPLDYLGIVMPMGLPAPP